MVLLCREIDKQGGFSDIKTSIEYVTDIDKFNSITEELPSLNETDYFKALNEISKLKETYKYNKPLFISDVYSVAKSYADSQRAFDYQNAIEKVYQVEVECNNTVTINAPNERFRFINPNYVIMGFMNAGISESEITKVINMFNFHTNKGIKTDVISAIGNWFGFDCIDVVGVLDSYNGGKTKSTVKMVLNPSKVKIIK